MEDSLSRDLGSQPLDAILDEIGLDNHRLVALSTEQLTHKQVQKARKGRRISANIQGKILRALNARHVPECDDSQNSHKVYVLTDLFTYQG